MTADAMLYRRWGIVGANVGPGVEYVFSRTGRPSRRFSTQDALLLEGCASWRTLDEHARSACARQGTREHYESFRKVLGDLAASGYLLSSEEVLSRLASKTTEAAPCTLATLAIPTRGCGPTLERCIASFAENAASFERTMEIVVADDSASQESLACLRAIPRLPRVRFSFFGEEQKRRFVAAVARESGAPEPIVAFAMLGAPGFPGAGANRNVLLLHRAGECFLSVDDDVTCRFGRPRHHANPSPTGPAITSAMDSLDMFIFEDQAAALAAAAVPDAPLDVLALYEASLGRTAFGLLSDPSVDVASMNQPLEERLEGAAARVRVVMAGIAGDSGMANPSWFLGLPPRARERLLESKARYDAYASRQVLRVARQDVVTDSVFLMSYAMAVDARDLVPPFVPFGRNQDGLFGVALSRCIGGALIAHLPWAVHHLPEPARAFPPEDVWRSVSRVRSDIILRMVMMATDTGPGKSTDDDRLHAVGAQLAEHGALSPERFRETLRFMLWTNLKSHATSLGAALRAQGERPDYWAADVKRALDLLAETAARPEQLLFDLPGSDLLERGAALQPLMRNLGALFQAWPEIFSAAQRLRERGETFATSV